MTREERLDLLKQIEKDIYVSSLESTFLEDAKSCAIHSVIEELEQEPRWIPVSERLPEPQANGGDKDLSEWVLVSLSTSKFDTVCGAFYCFSEKKWYRERVAFGTVTAWMPLPKPYMTESEGK